MFNFITMRKFILSAAVPLCAGLLGVAIPATAQDVTAPEPGTDMTSYIKNADFATNGTFNSPSAPDGWVSEGGGVIIEYNVCEAYQEQHNDLYIYQEIDSLPMGFYSLTAEGFYRPGWNDGGAAYKATGATGVCPAEFFLATATQDLSAKLCCIYATDYESTVNANSGYPDGRQGARHVFDAHDDYLVTMDNLVVGEDGKLTLGIRGIERSYGGLWSCWGNFKLTYLGPLDLERYRSWATQINNDIYNTSGMSSGANVILASLDSLVDINYGETVAEVESNIAQMLRWQTEMEAIYAAEQTFGEIMAECNDWISQNLPGKAELEEVVNSMSGVLMGETAPDGTPYYAADLDSLGTVLYEAIRNYRLSETIPAEGLEASFVIESPWFTTEGGDIHNSGYATSEGWLTNNIKADGSEAAGDFRLNTFGPEGATLNWWNNWAPNSTDCAHMDLYQEYHNLPAGYYSFSCIHTTDAAIVDQRAYAQSSYDLKESALPTKITLLGNSGWNTDPTHWDTLYVDSVFVGNDGYLRIGMHSNPNTNSSAGWFCVTGFEMKYYGAGDESVDEEMRKVLLQRGDTLLTREFLAVQKEYLKAGMETLKAADISTTEAANAAFETFTAVLDSAETAIDDMAAFRTDLYDPIVAMQETVTSDELLATIIQFQGLCDQTIAAEGTTVELFGLIKTQAAAFKEYADAYVASYEYSSTAVEEVKAVMDQVLTAQNTAVTENPMACEQAATNVTDLLGFGKAYDKILVEFEVEGYDADTLTAIQTEVTNVINAMIADQDHIAQHTSALGILMHRLMLTAAGIELPDGSKDVTFWMTNPDIEDLTDAGGTSGTTSIHPNGWEGYTNNGNGAFWTSVDKANHGVIPSGNVKMEAWGGTPSTLNFNYYQTLKGLPAGYYRATVMAHDIQNALANGASKFYVSTSEGRDYVEPIYSHPVLTGDTMRYDTVYVTGEDGLPTTEIDRIDTVLDVNNDVYDLYTIDNILITNDGADMTIGVRRDSLGVCNWFSADNFKLYLLQRLNTGIEEVGIDGANGNDLVVYTQNGYIVVEGADDYTVYNIPSGIAYRKDQQLQPGIYVVQAADGRKAKVIVE